ncbi:MAG: hypothetical protein DCC43_15615 [Candidatus Brocadia sp.]|nr:hypothetical protein [Candidatus Brocadia sp. AMX3]RIJ89019.1 MAG: hypothetical protein DCC43_15615 [Candidatus Brocadia sp.]
MARRRGEAFFSHPNKLCQNFFTKNASPLQYNKNIMNITKLHKGDPSYPTALQTHPGDNAPEFITALGNLSILRNKPLALFCSVKCPGNIIL